MFVRANQYDSLGAKWQRILSKLQIKLSLSSHHSGNAGKTQMSSVCCHEKRVTVKCLIAMAIIYSFSQLIGSKVDVSDVENGVILVSTNIVNL